MGSDRLRSLAAAALLVPLLAAGLLLGRAANPGRADFAFCNQTEVSSLDPAIASGEPEGRVLRALFEGLTRADPAGGAPLPGVASDWTTSPDGLLWTFQLRPDARWTNGERVDADDFRASFLRLLHPATAARYAYLLWVVQGAEAFTRTAPGAQPDPTAVAITALSPDVLQLRLLRPCVYLPELLSFYALAPVHVASIAEHGRAWTRPGNIVTNGPFRLVERRLRDRIRLARFDDYWGASDVALQTIDVLAADGLTTQLNLYLAGDADWVIKPPPSLYPDLAGRSDLLLGGQFGATFLRFNVWGGPFSAARSDSPFGDPRVRAALTLALDRESLARDVMGAGRQPLDSFVPAGLPGYAPARLPPADVEAARRLLAEAGFPGGQGLPRFSLLYPHNESSRDFCEAVATQWRRRLGIEAELVNQVFTVFLDSCTQGLYDVSWGAWTGDYADPSTFLEIFLSGSGNNRTGWSNAAYDELLARAAAQSDQRLRNALFRQAEEILLAELPLAPVYQRVNMNLLAPRVRGFHDNLLDIHPLRDLWIEESRIEEPPR